MAFIRGASSGKLTSSLSSLLISPSRVYTARPALSSFPRQTQIQHIHTQMKRPRSPSPAQTRSGLASKPKMDQAQARNESTEGPNEWKKRAPYSIHDDNSGFKALYEASCHCERVKYELSRKEPLDSKLCHCTTCQSQHAAPFQWAAIFHKEDINFKNGHHDLEWYDPTEKSIEHKLPCKVRCSFCHSPIMDEGRNMILLFPSLIHFKSAEERVNFKPRCHMFYDQRVMDIPDGLPKWTGLDKSSELIEDSPPELVREVERKREYEREKEKNKDGEKGAMNPEQ